MIRFLFIGLDIVCNGGFVILFEFKVELPILNKSVSSFCECIEMGAESG